MLGKGPHKGPQWGEPHSAGSLKGQAHFYQLAAPPSLDGLRRGVLSSVPGLWVRVLTCPALPSLHSESMRSLREPSQRATQLLDVLDSLAYRVVSCPKGFH